MADVTPTWELEGFLERFDAWAERETLTPDQRVFVLHWIMSRSEDPYQGVRREPDFPNLWWGPVPNLSDGKATSWSARTGFRSPRAPCAATTSACSAGPFEKLFFG